MATLLEIRAAIKATLEANLTGFTVHRTMTGVANVPAAVVDPVAADFVVAMGRGVDTWAFDLTVLVARAEDALAQDKLDPYVDGGGSSSLRKVIFNNKTLGLALTDAHISGMSGYGGLHQAGGYTYVGAVLRLIVHTTSS